MGHEQMMTMVGEHPEAAVDRAWRCFQEGQLHQAEVIVRGALGTWPRSGRLWHLLALLAERAKQPDQALELAQRAAELEPGRSEIWTTLGDIHESRRELRRAIECYQQALTLRSDSPAALNNLAAVYKALGEIPAAVSAMQRALEIAPDLAAVRSNLLTTRLYDHRLTGDELLDEHVRLARWWSAAAPPQAAPSRVLDPARRLRIGYVSPDLCEHAVMRFFEPLLTAHDRRQFEIFLYSECPIVDAVGQRLRALGDTWRVTWMQSAADVARQIQADAIDILIDLAGHTRHNRLDILALRPAPVQATYLGYPGVTGLEAVDYRLTDAVLDPLDPRPPRGERLIRLAGGYACFRPPDAALEVAAAPCLSRGYVTLASHHPLLKLGPRVFAAWREILERAPATRLMLFRSDFQGDLRERVETLLEKHRLPRERVEIRAVDKDPSGYLRSFADADMVLDCFPFGGHTMTCEALWMGVPVLTLRGDRPAGRLSASVLTVLDLPEWITASEEEYIERAVAWCQRPDELAEVRRSLRGRVSQRLGAGPWIGHYEAALRGLWQAWCANPRRAEPAAPSSPLEPPVTPAPGGRRPASGGKQTPTPLNPGDVVSGISAAQWLARGEALAAEGRSDEALAAWDQAARLEPWVPDHALRIGNLLVALGRTEDALQQYRQAVAVAPDFFPAWAMLGQTLGNQGLLTDAEAMFDQALALRADPKAQIVRGTLLPAIYQTHEEITAYRQRFYREATRLVAEGVRVDPTQGAVPNSFLLAYGGGNVRDEQRAFAALIEPPAAARRRRLPRPASDGRIRIGLLSEYFCNHTIGSLWKGFAQHLDRRRFHLSVISAAGQRDQIAEHFQRSAERFLAIPPDPARALPVLTQLDLDLLLFADLGMSCNTLALAATRLAPVQCVSWGHPLTTGLPTIDYFLSGELYESTEADAHYTERLVRLAGLQTCYERPTASESAIRRENFPLPADRHWYGCPQTLFKFHPDFDPLLAEILRRDERGILVLIEGKYPQWTEQLRARWQRTMPDVLDRVYFLPALPREQFVALSAACDVMLDPPHFGGGNTTLEALAMGTPVVTWPSDFLRARLALGMYRHLDWLEAVATSGEDFVARAVSLASDPDRQTAARREILSRCGELFDHVASIRAFEPFFEEAVERSVLRRSELD